MIENIMCCHAVCTFIVLGLALAYFLFSKLLHMNYVYKLWLYSRYQLLTMAAMQSRDSKQWGEDATRRNSASDAGLRLYLLWVSIYNP